MDYRNADGSVAEMCGNGVRVFAHWLDRAGWLPDGGTLRARHPGRGARGAVRPATEVVGRHGPGARRPAVDRAASTGAAFAGIAVDVGNPHLACVTDVALDALDLTVPARPRPRAVPARGERRVRVAGATTGGCAMRVHERGVGETRSCGTGTVAAVVAALRAAGRDDGRRRRCDTPGGRLRVTVGDDTTVLHGPAVLVASGELDPDWWDAVDEADPPHDRERPP